MAIFSAKDFVFLTDVEYVRAEFHLVLYILIRQVDVL